MQCTVAEPEPQELPASRAGVRPARLTDGTVGIRGDYYAQCPSSPIKNAEENQGVACFGSRAIVSPTAMSSSTREPSCDRSLSSPRPDSRGSNSSDFNSTFQSTRGHMVFQRTQPRSATPTLQEHDGSELPARPAWSSRAASPTCEEDDTPWIRADKEVQRVAMAAERKRLASIASKQSDNQFAPEGVPPVRGSKDGSSTLPSGFRSRLSSLQSRPLTARQQAFRPRAEGRNWRGIERPPSALVDRTFEAPMTDATNSDLQCGPGPARAGHLGCAPGHSTQYSCRSEVWWHSSPGADRRRQGEFERSILASQQPAWDSELGYVDSTYGEGGVSPFWPSGRPCKAGDLPPLPGAEGGTAPSLGLSVAPPPKAPQPVWSRSPRGVRLLAAS